MTATETRQAIESILMVADNPVEPTVLAQLLEIPKADVEAMCDDLATEYEASGRGFILARVAGGYRFQSHPDLAPYVERFVLDGQSSRLSSAALETLAIVAYKQPISRMQIAAIRGVNVDGVLRTLQQRGYVDEVSRDPGPGNAVLFGTTDLFLERVGLDSTADLPPLGEFVPGADVVEALEDGLRPDPVEPPPAAAASTDEPAPGHASDDAVEGAAVAEESDPAEPEQLADAEQIVDEVPEGDAHEIDDPAEPEHLEAEQLAEGDVPDADDPVAAEYVEPASVEVAAEPESAPVESVEPASVEADADLAAPDSVDGGPVAEGLHEVDLGDADESVDLIAEEDAQLDDLAGPDPEPEAGASGDETGDVIDLVADVEQESLTGDREMHERPSELEEELAAIDALHADLSDADPEGTPTWSPAESSVVTTVRHDDPPEADAAAPFRPAPGLGGTGTAAGADGADLAAGEDLGTGQAPPVTGPDAGDD